NSHATARPTGSTRPRTGRVQRDKPLRGARASASATGVAILIGTRDMARPASARWDRKMHPLPVYGERVASAGWPEPGEGQCNGPSPGPLTRSDLSPHCGEREEQHVWNDAQSASVRQRHLIVDQVVERLLDVDVRLDDAGLLQGEARGKDRVILRLADLGVGQLGALLELLV